MLKIISKCKYAGDPEDEFCVDCDGLTILLDGKALSSIECGGYEESEEPVAGEPIIEEPVIEAPVEVVTSIPEVAIEQPTSDHAAPRDSSETTPTGTTGPLYTVKGVTVEIQAESGVSLEVKENGKSTWYKLSYTEKRTIPADADIELEREALWLDVNNEVDKQVAELI